MDITLYGDELKNDNQTQPQQEALRACALYSINERLFHEGRITFEKKQQVEQAIWKKYRV